VAIEKGSADFEAMNAKEIASEADASSACAPGDRGDAWIGRRRRLFHPGTSSANVRNRDDDQLR
jgi:hypothetical protein